MSRGLAAAVFAFVFWGLVPLFWRLLAGVPVAEVMAHRAVFCALFVVGYLTFRERARFLEPIRRSPKVALTLVATSALVATNGGLYVYGVNTHQVVATSLGYFVNPLVNVVLGVVVLGERLDRLQRLAVVIATLGVAYLSVRAGSLPWLSLALAGSFGTYGLLRKTVAIEAVAGLGIESLMMTPIALAYLVHVEATVGGSFVHDGATTTSLLVASGLVTAAPLAAFAYGARQLRYSTVGIVQFIGPTLQLGCAVFVFREPFVRDQLIGFGLIWCALGIYAYDAVVTDRAKRRAESSTRSGDEAT